MTPDQIRRKRYRLTYPERVKTSDAKYRLENKHKIAARSAVNYQLRAGYWAKPTICDQCGFERRVEAHHHDYSKQLDIRWLCKNCHEKEPV